MASYQNGGWYVHPGSNGKSQQYWNGSWYDTPQQNGGGGNNNSGGGGATLYGGTPLSAIQGPPVPAFSWSPDQWKQAEQDALAKLAPYYKQLLDLNNQDVNRAKAALESDYATGVRFNTQDYGNQMTQEDVTAGNEQRQTLDDLNSRGVLFQETAPGQPNNNVPQATGSEAATPTVGVFNNLSGSNPQATQQTMDNSGITTPPPSGVINQGQQPPGKSYSSLATTDYFDPLLNSQQARRNAIKNAIQKTTSTATNQFGSDIGQQNIGQTQYNLQQGEQENQQAMTMATDSYKSAAAKAGATTAEETAPYLDTNSATNVTGG